jgi:hypothetical protein
LRYPLETAGLDKLSAFATPVSSRVHALLACAIIEIVDNLAIYDKLKTFAPPKIYIWIRLLDHIHYFANLCGIAAIFGGAIEQYPQNTHALLFIFGKLFLCHENLSACKEAG